MFSKICIVFVVLLLAYSNATQNCKEADGTTLANCPLVCQNETDAILLPSATACDNELDDAACELLFPCESPDCDPANGETATPAADIEADGGPNVRALACTEPSVQDVALQCAKSCAMCCLTPEFNCDDDDTGIVDCATNKGKCKDANWTDIMSQYCPATCGLCASGNCADINNGCGTMKSLCRDIDFNAYMKENCARTCETCPADSTTAAPGVSTTTSGCKDIANNCAQNANLCTNTLYRKLMSEQCCKTCSGASTTSCVDTNSNCANWKRNGFCTNTSFYTPAQIKSYCGKTCGLC